MQVELVDGDLRHVDDANALLCGAQLQRELEACVQDLLVLLLAPQIPLAEDPVLELPRAALPLVELLLIGVLRDEPVDVHVDRERQGAHLEQVDQVTLLRADLVEEDHVLDEVEVEVGALLLRPLLPDVQQEDSLAAVEVESEDAVDAHQGLVHEACDASLLEILLQQEDRVRVVRADYHLLGALLQVLHDLLEHEHLAGDKLLLEVAFELSLAELLAFLEQLLLFVDQKDAFAAIQ